MRYVFLNHNGDLQEAANLVFTALKIPDFYPVDSVNVLKGYYYYGLYEGVRVKIEHNSYGHEDEYGFMVSFKGSEENLDKTIDKVVDILSSNFNAALEVNDELQVLKKA